MTNAELFKEVFGIYAEEFWAYPEEKMLDWLASDTQTADVRENIHAHWDKVEVRSGEWWHTCSKCKATWGSEDGELDFNYCPHCGAMMDEKGEEE